MGLEHVVVTTVTRDDLPDGGAAHFVAVIEAAACAACRKPTVEVLTSDFAGELASVDTVVAAGPDVYNHNLETVPRLYARCDRKPTTPARLAVLARVRATQATVARHADEVRPHARARRER